MINNLIKRLFKRKKEEIPQEQIVRYSILACDSNIAKTVEVYFGHVGIEEIAKEGSFNFIKPLNPLEVNFSVSAFSDYCKENFVDNRNISSDTELVRYYLGKDKWSVDEILYFLNKENELILSGVDTTVFGMFIFGDWQLCNKESALSNMVSANDFKDSNYLSILSGDLCLFNYSRYLGSKASN